MKGKTWKTSCVLSNIDEHLNRTHTLYEDYIHIKYTLKHQILTDLSKDEKQVISVVVFSKI